MEEQVKQKVRVLEENNGDALHPSVSSLLSHPSHIDHPKAASPELTPLSLRVKPSPVAAPAWSCCCSPASSPLAQQLLLYSQFSLGSA